VTFRRLPGPEYWIRSRNGINKARQPSTEKDDTEDDGDKYDYDQENKPKR